MYCVKAKEKTKSWGELLKRSDLLIRTDGSTLASDVAEQSDPLGGVRVARLARLSSRSRPHDATIAWGDASK